MKIYFAGSIRGGRVDANLYNEMIEYIKNKGHVVLTEHVGDLSKSLFENEKDAERLIYQQDTSWLRESDLLIGECSCPSLGVGYELAYAESHQIPCYVFYNKDACNLSAMIKGDDYYHIYPYYNKEEIFKQLDTILKVNL